MQYNASEKGGKRELKTVGPLSWCGEDVSDCVEHHPHYMWVPIVTLAQAAISFLPHYLWYYWEGEDYIVTGRALQTKRAKTASLYLLKVLKKSSLDGKMRKLVANLKEKRFYTEDKTGLNRLSPTSELVRIASGQTGIHSDVK